MLRFITFMVLGTFALGLACGCGDDDSSDDGDTNTGSDTETESDTGSYDIECDGTPAACEDIGATDDEQSEGCCDGEVLYYCVQGSDELSAMDCEYYGLECKFDYYYASMRCL